MLGHCGNNVDVEDRVDRRGLEFYQSPSPVLREREGFHLMRTPPAPSPWQPRILYTRGCYYAEIPV